MSLGRAAPDCAPADRSEVIGAAGRVTLGAEVAVPEPDVPDDGAGAAEVWTGAGAGVAVCDPDGAARGAGSGPGALPGAASGAGDEPCAAAIAAPNAKPAATRLTSAPSTTTDDKASRTRARNLEGDTRVSCKAASWP